MKKMLIASFDMEVGGVERSLISMLNHLDYEKYQVDLMLYSHTGDFMHLLPHDRYLLAEMKAYRTFRMSIRQIFTSGQFKIGFARLLAKLKACQGGSTENGYKQMQYMWQQSLPFLPRLEKQFDVAISYLWPHYFVAEKVEAATKIAWIHTDYSTVDTDVQMDLDMWGKFDYLMAVSEACKHAFVQKYPALEGKTKVMENITAPDFVRKLAKERVHHPMVNEHRFKMITVARLSHAKGIDQAVKAMHLLKRRGYTDIIWYVVGYGGDEQMIKGLIAEYGLEKQFILLGKRTNPYPFVKAADLYVQPSRYEGKAVTVREAQILGKPVLITNYPTAKSQVNDGIDGMICDLSMEGIADGIEHLYHHPDLRGKLAINCQRANYQNERELEKLYELI